MGSVGPIFSIKQKIVLSHAVACVFILGIVVAVFSLLHILEDRIDLVQEISKLEEIIQNLRRAEKNVFLYDTPTWSMKVTFLIRDARTLFSGIRPRLARVASQREMEAFSTSLDRYERIMKRYLLAKESKSENSRNAIGQVQRDIRELGHSLSLFSEAIAKRKRSNIRDTMSSLNRLQLIQCLVFAAGLLGFGAFVFRKIIHPLEVLEKQTALIAEGQYELLEHSPQEAEIRDVFQSLNRMLERLKRREDELVQSRKLASLGTLLAGVAHELNNPLSNIRSSAEILLEDGDELDRDLIQANLEGIVEQVDRGHIIVLDLLELGRTREFSREELNLGQLVQSVLSLLHGEIGHHTVVHQSIDRGVTVYADKRRMQEVLMNLISNAVEACDYQGDITIEASMDKDSTVILSVKDNGRGIERDTVNRIFDPFFTTKDVGKGTGLGLFLTHEILVRHGGRIWVESTPGQGSSFFVRLPGRRRE